MAAFIGIHRRTGRHRAGVPYNAVVLNIVVFAIGIQGKAVIAVSGKAEQLCVFVEAVAATGVGNQRKEVSASQIVDPRKRSIRSGDHILFRRIVKITELHKNTS